VVAAVTAHFWQGVDDGSAWLGTFLFDLKYAPTGTRVRHVLVHHSFTSLVTLRGTFIQPLLPPTPRSSTRIDFSSESLVMDDYSVHLREESGESGLARNRRMTLVHWTHADPRNVGLVTIDVLPDNVLVEIFSYVNIVTIWDRDMEHRWHALVHVCRRWRYLVFASPRRLNLRLKYRGHRPMSEVLGVWPVLPVILRSVAGDQGWDNSVAALESEQYSHICGIQIFNITNSDWERFAAAMQKPFPELIYLEVSASGYGEVLSTLPDSFLGRSAPRLRELKLRSIPFPSIPKLLLSANGLVKLSLSDIPDSGYFSPDAMATALTVMTRLEILRLRFLSYRSRPDPASRPLSPPTRFVLPTLTRFTFEGVYEYLEDLLARIDAPLLHYLNIIFFIDLDFDLPHLHRLIGHAEAFKTFDRAQVLIFDEKIQLDLYAETGTVGGRRRLRLHFDWDELDWQLSSLSQVCNSSFPLIAALEELKIEGLLDRSPRWKDDTENARWLELLDPFAALKNLYLTDEIPLQIFSALLERSRERVTEVLPTLQNLFISPGYLPEGSRTQKAITRFIATQRRSGHPLSVHHGSRSEGWEDITKDLASGD